MAYVHVPEDVCKFVTADRYNQGMLTRQAESEIILGPEDQFRSVTDAEFAALRDEFLCDGGRSVEQILQNHSAEEICAVGFGDITVYNWRQKQKGAMVANYPELLLTTAELRRAQRALCGEEHPVWISSIGALSNTVLVPSGHSGGVSIVPISTAGMATQIGGFATMAGEVPTWEAGPEAIKTGEVVDLAALRTELEQAQSSAKTMRLLAIGGAALAATGLLVGGFLLLRRKKPRRRGKRR